MHSMETVTVERLDTGSGGALMPGQHTEKAFETAIEHHLLTVAGYTRADPDRFDRDHAVDPTILIPFIQETQPRELEYLKNLQKDKTQQTLIYNLCNALD